MGIDPVTLMMIGRGVALASTVVSTIGTMQASSYQAAVAARNAQLAEENAQAAIEASQQEQQDWGDEARSQLGTLVAGLSASGASLQGGTVVQRKTGAQRLLSRDAQRIREEGDTTAARYRQQGADFRAESAQAKRRGRFALFSGALEAGGTYLSNSSRISSARASLIA